MNKAKDNELIQYIEKIVQEKIDSGDWDNGIRGQTDNLFENLLYEYSSSIEKLTEGKITARQVVDKLSKNMGKLRIGDFKTGIDDNIYYDGLSVTSDDYKRKCRIDINFGAHTLTYKDENGEDKSAVVLFDKEQEKTINGVNEKLSGIDLQDLSDIRSTIFHEWTHVMGKCFVKASELTKNDIIYKNEKSVYINSMLSTELSKQEYEEYVSNIDSLLQENIEILFVGIATIELNDNKDPNKRIIHNQIDEGVAEYVSRKVMEVLGEQVKHQNRYFKQVRIIGKIFEGRGLADYLTMYLTKSNELIRKLESERVQNKDMLHYISDYINSSYLSRLFNKFKIDKQGNIQPGAFQKLESKIKKMFRKRGTFMISLSGQTSAEKENQENNWLERIKVKHGELIENDRQQENRNNIKQKDNKDGPSLDD